MKYDYILKIIKKLKARYETQDVYELCKRMGIIINPQPMGTHPKAGKGFFTYKSRIKVITVNSNLPAVVQMFIVAHELGHAVLHFGCGTQMFSDRVLFDETAVTEKEANLFAAEILMEDEEVIGYLKEGLSFFETASALNVPAELLDFKLRIMRMKGYALGLSPITADSKFLKDLQIPENHEFDPA